MSTQITGGKWRGRALFTPRATAVRPTSALVRQALFDILRSKVEGSRFLELFAGSGAISFEALSRGASSGCAVEHNRAALYALRRNAEQLECTGLVTILPIDVRKALKGEMLNFQAFDWLFADPPYAFVDDQKFLDAFLIGAARVLAPLGWCILERAWRGSAQAHYSPFTLLESRRYGDSCLEFLQSPVGKG